MKRTKQTTRGLLRRSFASVLTVAALAAAVVLVLPSSRVEASSHSDAPLIKLDPQANLTDVYAFIRTRPGGEKVLVVEVNVRPFSEPGDGVMYDAFSSDALYSIHITNPATGVETQRYDFQFSPVQFGNGNYKNGNTILRYGRGTEIGPILNVGDARQNFTQNYNVVRTVAGQTMQLNRTVLLVPPPNVGKNTTPSYNDANGVAVSGATTRARLDRFTFQTTYDLPGGTTVFAGPREDGFFADTPAIFDLLDGRILGNSFGQAGGGVDGFKGYNVLHYAIVIPVSQLTPSAYTGALQPASTGVGVYASVSRPSVTLRSADQADGQSTTFVQVNRLANPLFNEVLVALQDKDNYNRRPPTDDAAMFATYALNPEIAVLLNAVFNQNFQTTNRVDLQAIYIPDVIRVNTNTGSVRTAGEPGFNRLSFIGGDTIDNGSGTPIPSGWPNGRRFGDDVVDIALTAVANGPAFNPPLTVVGDNAAANDQVYNRTFPYAATPHAGPRNSKDSGPNIMPTPVPAAPETVKTAGRK